MTTPKIFTMLVATVVVGIAPLRASADSGRLRAPVSPPGFDTDGCLAEADRMLAFCNDYARLFAYIDCQAALRGHGDPADFDGYCWLIERWSYRECNANHTYAQGVCWWLERGGVPPAPLPPGANYNPLPEPPLTGEDSNKNWSRGDWEKHWEALTR